LSRPEVERWLASERRGLLEVNNSQPEHRRACRAALAIGLALSASSVHAAEALPEDIQALRAEIRDLTAQMQALAARDQAEIERLSNQVNQLQSQATRASQRTPEASAPNSQTIAGVAPTPQATPEREKAVPRVVQNAANRFELESADGEYSIGFTGDIQLDSGAYASFHPASNLAGPQGLSNGINARRARLGVTGTAFGSWGYALVFDAGNSSDQTAKGIETAQIIYSGLPGAAFEIGYSNTFFTLDQATSSNDTLFLERASPSNIATSLNAGDSRTNAGVRFFGDSYWVGAYVTGPASGDSHTLTAERLGAFQRVAIQALKGKDYSLHLGLGLDELLQAPNAGKGTPATVALSDQPELRIDPTTLLNTGALGTAANPVTRASVIDLETAANYKNLFWQGEYYRYQIARSGLRAAKFDGVYGEVAWALTGEAHRYNSQAGSYFRIAPTRPFSLKNHEWGAWELAARVSYVDLNSNFQNGETLAGNPAAVDGGLQRAYTLGLNWYPNNVVRLLLDYNRISYEKANGAAQKGLPLGAPIGAAFNAISFRVQVAY